MITINAINWDDAFLTLTRLLIAGAANWAVLILYHMLKRPKSHQTIVVVPRAILWFTLVWNTIVLTMSLGLVIFNASVVSTGFSRTIYGVSLGWAIFGLAWILAIGSKGSKNAVDVMNSLQSENRNLTKDKE